MGWGDGSNGSVCERLERLPEKRCELRSMRSRKCDARAAAHDENSVAMKPGLQLDDPLDVHDRRPMDPNKSCGVELRFESRQRFRVAKDADLRVYADVIVFRLDPRNIVGINKERTP